MNSRPRVAFAMEHAPLLSQLLDDDARARLASVADVVADDPLTEFASDRARDVLAEIDVLITGWGSPRVTAEVLALSPQLRLIAHAAGTVKPHLDESVWDRGVIVTTAAAANAIPVAEYTLAFILLAGKKTFESAHALRRRQSDFTSDDVPRDIGNHGATVGVIGASLVGRRLLTLLRAFSFRVLLADPTLSVADAESLGVELVPLDELMRRSAVVTLHAPVLPATIGMIGSEQLRAMKTGATFINTARGALVDHDALRRELVSGRISAVLDVTDPEPLPAGDPLYDLPNVIVTPHIAGSLGNELAHMGGSAVREVELFAAGLPNEHVVTRQALAATA